MTYNKSGAPAGAPDFVYMGECQLVTGQVKPVVEETVGGEVGCNKQKGTPPGEDTQADNEPDQRPDGPEYEPHAKAGGVLESRILDHPAAKDLRKHPKRGR